MCNTDHCLLLDDRLSKEFGTFTADLHINILTIR